MADVLPVLQILVVEDIASMRELMSQALSGIPGFAISGTAANGWEARLEISKRRPDLILLDEILPGESSVDLLEQFVSDGIPVILLTGISEPTHPVTPLARGRIRKPSWNSLAQDQVLLREQILKMLGSPTK